MSNLDELIESIKFSVGLPNGDDEEDLLLDPEYAISIGASTIERLKEKLDMIKYICADPKNRTHKTLYQQCAFCDSIIKIIDS